jgi:predicted metal-dependent hydrolase
MVPDQIIYSKRKTLSLTIDSYGRLIVKAPTNARRCTIDHFIQQKQGWITKKQEDVRNSAPPVSALQLTNGEKVPYLGKLYTLVRDTCSASADFGKSCGGSDTSSATSSTKTSCTSSGASSDTSSDNHGTDFNSCASSTKTSGGSATSSGRANTNFNSPDKSFTYSATSEGSAYSSSEGDIRVQDGAINLPERSGLGGDGEVQTNGYRRHLQTAKIHENMLYIPQGWTQKEFVRWLRRQSRAVIEARVEHFAEAMQLEFARVRITGARQRWGSCSGAANLNFTWRLIFCAPASIDYVVVHELSHIPHRNHSKAFWRTVAGVLPEYKKAQNYLRANRRLTEII